MMSKVKKLSINTIVPCIWITVGYVWDMWYHLIRGVKMLDSDMSHELILSELLNREHSISGMSTNWLYDSELRFLGMQWIYRMGLAIFPRNWHMARTFSMALALALLVFAVWLFFYSIGRSRLGLWAAALAVFPGGGWYFWQTIYGGYFITYILISLFSFSLIMLSVKAGSKTRKSIYIGILMILGISSGINGIKQLMVFYVPLCLSAVIIFILCLRKCGEGAFSRKLVFHEMETGFLVLSVTASAMAFIGYLINSCILSKHFHFEQYDETIIEYQGFLECLKMYVWSFGFADGKILMSPPGIASILGVLFGVLVIASGIRLMMRLLKYRTEDRTIIVFSTVSILFCCFVYAYLGGHGAIQYLQPVIPQGYFLVVLEVFTDPWIDSEKSNRKISDRSSFVIMNLIMILMLTISLGTIHNENDSPFHKYRARTTLKPVVDKLLEMGYRQGVASFWTSDVTTEISNGMIEMWTISTESPDVWDDRGQRKDHLSVPPKGKYFYLFDMTRGEDEANVDVGLAYIEKHQEAGVLTPIYFDEDFIVYGN